MSRLVASSLEDLIKPIELDNIIVIKLYEFRELIQ